MNGAFSGPLVETEKGGTGGGGAARLTPLGRKVLARYRAMQRDAERAIAAGIADLKRDLRR
jgi:molybdate transport system regulatory protein